MTDLQKQWRALPEEGSFDSNLNEFPAFDISPDLEWSLQESDKDQPEDAAPFGDMEEIYSTHRKFDLRDIFDFPPIRNQDETDTCSAFAIAGLIEFLHLSNTDRVIQLSTGWMHACIGEKDLRSGIQFDVLAKKLNGRQIPLVTTSYPWRDTNCYRDAKVKMPDLKSMEQDYSTEFVKKVIRTGRPIVTALRINREFSDWNTRDPYIYDRDKRWGPHAVMVIGYDRSGWICRNSYGTNWGYEGGLFRVNFGDCRLCTGWYRFFTYAQPTPMLIV